MAWKASLRYLKKMENLVKFFEIMSDVSFQYVVLRNWTHLPYTVKLGDHSDLDLLVYDIDHWIELFPEAKRVYPHPRVQFKLPVADSFIQIDVRHVGDGYYPKKFEQAILDKREWNKMGFYTPDATHHRLALAYHAVHHKNRNDYRRFLGHTKVEDLLQALKDSTITWTKPDDPSVGQYNQYFKGATAVVEKKNGRVVKKQINYGEYDLLANEWRILSQAVSPHFPFMYNNDKEGLTMEDCGEELLPANLPGDWKVQMLRIMNELKKFNIQHRDIKPDNFMVKKGIIKLIDFGWSRFNNDPPDSPPDCLGYPYKASWGFDDNYSMVRVIKRFEYLKEEMGVKQ